MAGNSNISEEQGSWRGWRFANTITPRSQRQQGAGNRTTGEGRGSITRGVFSKIIRVVSRGRDSSRTRGSLRDEAAQVSNRERACVPYGAGRWNGELKDNYTGNETDENEESLMKLS